MPTRASKKSSSWQRLSASSGKIREVLGSYRYWVGLIGLYLVFLGLVSIFYLRRDVMSLQPGDMVLMDIHAPRTLLLPKTGYTLEDLKALAEKGGLDAQRAKGIGPLALGGLRHAFMVVESAQERKEAGALVRVEEPHLPEEFPLEDLLLRTPNERLTIRWAAHRGLKELYAKGIPLHQNQNRLRERLMDSGAFADLKPQLQLLALDAAMSFIMPDAHADMLATLDSRIKQDLGPKRRVYEGERILRAGDRLELEHIPLLKEFGDEIHTQLGMRLMFLGVVLFLALAIFLRLVQLADPHLFRTGAFFWVALVTGLVLFLSVPVAMKVKFAYLGYGLGGILVFNVLVVATLYRPVVASLLILFQTILLVTVFMIPSRFILPGFLVAGLCLLQIGPRQTRVDLLKVGALCAGAAVLLALWTEISLNKPWSVVLKALPIAGGSVLAGTLMALGALPIFEKVFSLATANTLLELANPNHPLLRKIFTEAPGTYHHSMMMANLSEAAAEALGGDALFARVACYYHDIGKTRRPEFFTENTNVGETSAHEGLAPSLSALVIVNHVKEGIEMGRAARLPESIIRVIPAHHGTSMVSYFYNKAKIQSSGAPVEEGQFRYPGPKPQTLEEGIIMLADVCEAGVRSLSQFSIKAVEDQVERLMQSKLEDGQLDECNLTLQQLEVIRQVFVKTLCKVYHHRINYDKGLAAEMEKVKAAKEGKSGG